MVRLLLDDFRDAPEVAKHMERVMGPELVKVYEEEWIVVKDYEEFMAWITEKGLPDLISFDHDLSEEHYSVGNAAAWNNYYNRPYYANTGRCAAVWLVNYCRQHKLALPQYIIHTMNPVGGNEIQKVLSQFQKQQ